MLPYGVFCYYFKKEDPTFDSSIFQCWYFANEQEARTFGNKKWIRMKEWKQNDRYYLELWLRDEDGLFGNSGKPIKKWGG